VNIYIYVTSRASLLISVADIRTI